MAATEQTKHSFLDTTFPVHLPEIDELKFSKDHFTTYLHTLKAGQTDTDSTPLAIRAKPADEGKGDVKQEDATAKAPAEKSAFMDGLLADKATAPTLDERDGKMLTENADVAHATSGEVLVDLFHELEDVIDGERLDEVLEKAWAEDAESTLKIIWNARSIHLGKSSRPTFYRAVGWLYTHHPATLIVNLPWLVRPLIQKTAPKEVKKEAENKAEVKDDDSDFEVIDEKELSGQPETKKLKLDDDAVLAEFDIKYGVAHGYWKDLLNLLALAANDELKVDGDPRKVLNVEKPKDKPFKRDWTEGRKKTITQDRHNNVVEKLQNDSVYKALHVSVARLFAGQLKLDFARLESGSKQDLKAVTLAAKWAPTHKGMHDQHTCIVTSIAELLYSFDEVCPEADPGDRTLYIKHARQRYHFTVPKLRKHLQIVERPIAAEKFDEIKYERVPSLAMKQYTPLFAKKDFDRFDKYIDNVAQGKASISGATLLPSTLVKDVIGDYGFGMFGRGNARTTAQMVEKKMQDIKVKSLGGQWSTLVQRIKDSGTLESSIAIADVSGSMHSPVFPDKTRPIDSSIGLALLIAEVTKPPFGGAFITFSDQPQVMRVGGSDDKRTFEEKIQYIEGSNWSMNTNFVAVFENLILPMAIENKLTQEDMVKQVFVFSDMQFDGCGGGARWTSSYERIQKKYKDAGYEMPQLIFWNLAGGRGGIAPKPVTADEKGTALVSGYSQGQLKMFLESGQFEDPEEEEVVTEVEDGEEVVVEKHKEKKKQDPLAMVKKAISHDAYRMLKVVD